MRAPIAAYCFVVLVCLDAPGVVVLASLCLPIAPDFNIFRTAAILLTGLA